MDSSRPEGTKEIIPYRTENNSKIGTTSKLLHTNANDSLLLDNVIPFLNFQNRLQNFHSLEDSLLTISFICNLALSNGKFLETFYFQLLSSTIVNSPCYFFYPTRDGCSSFSCVFAANFSLHHFQIRKGRLLTLQECLKKEFRLTMNILRTLISGDVYEVIRSLIANIIVR